MSSWGRLLSGRQGISGTERSSTQNYSYAEMACGVVYPDPHHKSLGKEINIVYLDTLETTWVLVSSLPNNNGKSQLLNKHNIHADKSVLKVDSGSGLKSFFFFFFPFSQ